MGSLGDYLMEELSLKTSFTIPIGGYSSTAVSRNNMGDHGNRSVALHHIRTEPESHTRKDHAVYVKPSGWFHL